MHEIEQKTKDIHYQYNVSIVSVVVSTLLQLCDDGREPGLQTDGL